MPELSLAALVEQAAAFERSGDPRRAAIVYQEILAREPAHPTARQQLAAALFSYAHTLRRRGAIEWDPLESTCRHASLSIL